MMDANGQRFWTLGDARHFPALAHAVWDRSCHVLRLASERSLQSPLGPLAALAAAQAALNRIPRAVDGMEGVARWDPGSAAVVVHSHLPNDAVLLPLPQTPTDLCAGADGLLYVALPDAVYLHDLRGRWAGVRVSLAGFHPWRLAPAADGGVWALERNTGRLARLAGRPRRTQTPQPDDYAATVFRPTPENGDAPVLTLLDTPSWAPAEVPQALAAAPDGALALLTWLDANAQCGVRRWLADESRWSAPQVLQGAEYGHAIAWLAPDRIALRLPGRRDAPAYDLGATGVLMPLGRVYPLAATAQEAPFANGAVQPPYVPSGERGAEPLYPLSLNTLARRGQAAHYAGSGDAFTAHLLDSGSPTTVWHRLVAEAGIPAHCGFVAWLAATNEPRPPADDDLAAWHAHGFGRDIAALDPAMGAPHLPRAAWDRAPSELPGHPGFLSGERVPGSRGLFSVLVQNTRQRVRTLVGRYLWVRLVLHGDGRATPEIAALRAWGSRFSYADQYLPRLYRENLFGDAAQAPGEELARIDLAHAATLDAGGAPSAALRARLLLEDIRPSAAAQVVVERPHELWLLQDGASAWRLARGDGAVVVYRPQATPADFNARLLGNFEGVLTQLEDRVAAAHLLSHPAAVPEAHLDWLAAWIGIAFDPALPATRRRAWLAAAPDLALRHGTRDGLRLALDLATGGGVRGGEIIVIESFRLRRILATLLGVDLADEQDPLLPGLQVSGNSVVGDTLTLGDHESAELMALFRDDPGTSVDDDAVLRFYERLSHRALVLVHREVEAQDFALIRRIVRLESPAHVEVQVAAATWPLLVGVASLVGVDTYLGPPRPARPVQVQRSVLGLGDLLIGPGVLDPRVSGAPGAGSPLLLDAPPTPATQWRWWPPA